MSEIDTRLKELAAKLNRAARNAFYRGARQEQADLISAHDYLLEYAAQLEINEWQEMEIARLQKELRDERGIIQLHHETIARLRKQVDALQNELSKHAEAELEIARLRKELRIANENIDNLRREANTAHKNERDMSRIIWNANKSGDLAGLAAYVAQQEAAVKI